MSARTEVFSRRNLILGIGGAGALMTVGGLTIQSVENQRAARAQQAGNTAIRRLDGIQMAGVGAAAVWGAIIFQAISFLTASSDKSHPIVSISASPLQNDENSSKKS